MTAKEVKDICLKKGITFIPHHDCALCGEFVGWNIQWNGVPYFDPSCGCGYGCGYDDTWENVAEWILDDNGEPRGKYAEMLKI